MVCENYCTRNVNRAIARKGLELLVARLIQICNTYIHTYILLWEEKLSKRIV